MSPRCTLMTGPLRRSFALALTLTSLALAALARPAALLAGEDQPPTAAAADAVPGLEDPPGIGALKYRSIGPAWGGRVSRVAGAPGNPAVFFAATASGGVWR